MTPDTPLNRPEADAPFLKFVDGRLVECSSAEFADWLTDAADRVAIFSDIKSAIIRLAAHAVRALRAALTETEQRAERLQAKLDLPAAPPTCETCRHTSDTRFPDPSPDDLHSCRFFGANVPWEAADGRPFSCAAHEPAPGAEAPTP